MDYHSRMARLLRILRQGLLGRGNIEGFFCGEQSRPIQFAFRDQETQIVELGDLHIDGSIQFRGLLI